MGYTARWGPKGFIVSPEKIAPIGELQTSFAVNTDSGEDTSGTAPTNTKGKEPQQISLSVTYLRGAGVDPRAQIEEWDALIGQVYPLYIGGKRFGPQKLMLSSIDISDVYLTNSGVFIQAVIGLTFLEHVEQASTTTTASASSGTSGSAAVSVTQSKPNAMKTASKWDRQRRKSEMFRSGGV